VIFVLFQEKSVVPSKAPDEDFAGFVGDNVVFRISSFFPFCDLFGGLGSTERPSGDGSLLVECRKTIRQRLC
jgi:hypothetical protein